MRKGLLAICLIGTAAAGQMTFADESKPVEEYDFGTKIVAVSVRPRFGVGKPAGSYLTHARVRRLGDRFFIQGATFVPAGAKWTAGNVWHPLSEVVRILEFDSAEEVMKAFSEGQKEPSEEGGRQPAPSAK